MNKGGGIFGIFSLFIIILVAMVLIMAQNKPDFSSGDIENVSKVLNWSNSAFTPRLSNFTNGNYYHDVIIEGVFKYVDVLGWCVFEVAKLAMKFAIDNPNIINGKILMLLLILSLLAPLIYPAFIVTVSFILIIKEWLTVRRERKALNHQMKGGQLK
jgi:hypothetical protein